MPTPRFRHNVLMSIDVGIAEATTVSPFLGAFAAAAGSGTYVAFKRWITRRCSLRLGHTPRLLRTAYSHPARKGRPAPTSSRRHADTGRRVGPPDRRGYSPTAAATPRRQAGHVELNQVEAYPCRREAVHNPESGTAPTKGIV